MFLIAYHSGSQKAFTHGWRGKTSAVSTTAAGLHRPTRQSTCHRAATPWKKANLTATTASSARRSTTPSASPALSGLLTQHPPKRHQQQQQQQADGSARGPAIPQVSVLFALGPGMAGYPAVLHGGVTALLFDELLGMLGERNRDLGRGDAIFTMKPATATMNVRYLRPIATPSVVLGVGTIASITGRKMLLRGEIRDAEGNVVATCESLWVAMAGREKEKL
ncbi:uncharacterized protein VDAG_02839 [Verticillium dahliae VdLs.17]|uniref:Thioesterase domain-containing protein n=1 Tax=Verticillium dahliae (strain VdLs.17 / ATCC MYA-4575 / FGSC 10137) TaxID=498257 RepID=G2WX60_VERDV|nr:uncharacterized protein VDAG_02839 [Verticillium dahliae VdLs.17]EGY21315.1 hypothetical protein VDAG_02839 [Verticillium dahliae VdLs.17]